MALFDVPDSSIGQQLLDVPFSDMIRSMGLAIAQAQFELDQTATRLAQMMSGKYQVEVPDDMAPSGVRIEERESYVHFDGEDLSLLELGFTPTFYQFVDTIIEVKISITMTASQSYSRTSKVKSVVAAAGWYGFGGGMAARTSSVSASYASKYQYSAEGSSLLRTKLVVVPAPPVLEERIRDVLEKKKAAEADGDGDG
ncbi:MAG: hypothetical protein H6981_10790 [Gammaproteobacteria bacterium]|nr:hypothetical protein [Gammaproteobacteria bacterium]MCP5137275.1 hypothetical protein [Gammaproteobacteria bacterium]